MTNGKLPPRVGQSEVMFERHDHAQSRQDRRAVVADKSSCRGNSIRRCNASGCTRRAPIAAEKNPSTTATSAITDPVMPDKNVRQWEMSAKCTVVIIHLWAVRIKIDGS
ncbi:MAG TPA: hypothetical protein PK156_29310 [Polyangium sp.]|nr:hypothetical protein [Polyangium sp.]